MKYKKTIFKKILIIVFLAGGIFALYMNSTSIFRKIDWLMGEGRLIKAIENQNFDSIETLYKSKPKLDLRNDSGYSIIHQAVLKKEKKSLRYLLELGFNPNIRSSNPNKDIMPLHLAAKKGFVDIAELLLDYGAKIDDIPENGPMYHYSPLLLSAKYGNYRVTSLLLEHGADPDRSHDLTRYNKPPTTAYDYARQLGYKKVISVLNKYNATPSSYRKRELHAAIAHGDIQKVGKLLDKGVNPNSIPDTGPLKSVPPLHLAINRKKLEISKSLIKHDARVDLVGSTGERPLHLAARLGSIELIKLLLEKDANIKTETDHGMTALHIASGEGNLDVVKVLLETGAGINEKGSVKQTPLDFASAYGRTEIVNYLLSNGAEVNPEISSGLTPIWNAVINGHIESVKLLVNNGANLKGKYKNGWNLLHAAAFYGHEKIVRFLLEHGVDVNAKTNNGTKPIDLAKKKNHKRIVDILSIN